MSKFKVGQRVWLIEEKKYAVITKVDDITFFEKVAYDIEIKSDNYKGWRFDYQLHQTADDMFEDLGYRKVNSLAHLVSYETVSDNGFYVISFNQSKQVYYAENRKRQPFGINAKEHQAIHQKMVELGWL